MADNRLVDPQAMARISRMELIARQAVEGFLSGKHPSPYHGSSVEYADHRPYALGDEIRTIDWKLLAKTDKYYIKLFEEQTNLRCTIVLDASRSMAFGKGGSGGRRGSDKLTYGSYLALALGYLMLRQNDSVGLALFDDQVRHYLPARSTASHFRLMAQQLDKLKPAGDTRLGAILHELAGRLPRRGMVILISDLVDDVEQIKEGLARFRYRKHEVIFFHVMDPDELTFPFERLTRFRDAEGASSVVANPRTVRKRYLERLGAFMDRIRKVCLERDISYQLARTDVPYEQMLTSYLHSRSRLTK
jgi:uncharacterized protein (DUF58 family)